MRIWKTFFGEGSGRSCQMDKEGGLLATEMGLRKRRDDHVWWVEGVVMVVVYVSCVFSGGDDDEEN